jgi:hypothetical protein
VSIAVDAGDAIHVVWYDATPGRFQVYYRKSPDTGITWGATRQLADTIGVSYTPAIAADPDSTPHRLVRQHLRASYNPDMAIEPGNAIHAVWYDDTPVIVTYCRRSAMA